MKEKVIKIEELRERSLSLDPAKKNFADNLKDLAQEAMGYCQEPDDDQEIQWLKKSIQISESSTENLEERDRGLSYLREAIDSILIRERKYLE